MKKGLNEITQNAAEDLLSASRRVVYDWHQDGRNFSRQEPPHLALCRAAIAQAEDDKRTKKTQRVYAEFKDFYGRGIRIAASSLFGRRAVWIQNEVVQHNGLFSGNAHLTVPMAKRVIRALQAFINGED